MIVPSDDVGEEEASREENKDLPDIPIDGTDTGEADNVAVNPFDDVSESAYYYNSVFLTAEMESQEEQAMSASLNVFCTRGESISFFEQIF